MHAVYEPIKATDDLSHTRQILCFALAMSTEVKMEFDPKGMPFRRLGSSGLRVPLLSLGACMRCFSSTLQFKLTVLQGSPSVVPSRATPSRCLSRRVAQVH